MLFEWESDEIGNLGSKAGGSVALEAESSSPKSKVRLMEMAIIVKEWKQWQQSKKLNQNKTTTRKKKQTPKQVETH